MAVKTCVANVEPKKVLVEKKGIMKIVIHKDERDAIFTITDCRKEDCIIVRKGNADLWIGK